MQKCGHNSQKASEVLYRGKLYAIEKQTDE